MRVLCKLSSNFKHSFQMLSFYLSIRLNFYNSRTNFKSLACADPPERIVRFTLTFFSLARLCKYFVIRSKLNGKVINFLTRIENFLSFSSFLLLWVNLKFSLVRWATMIFCVFLFAFKVKFEIAWWKMRRMEEWEWIPQFDLSSWVNIHLRLKYLRFYSFCWTNFITSKLN